MIEFARERSLTERYGSVTKPLKNVVGRYGRVTERYRSVMEPLRSIMECYGSVIERYRAVTERYCTSQSVAGRYGT